MIRILALLALLLTAPAVAAETVYFSVMDDLPLMQGMTERKDEAFFFDKPNGRIAAFAAQVSATPDDVRRFYGQALPPLGWRELSPGIFVRDEDKLRITLESKAGQTLVRFSVTPATEGN